MKKYCVPTLVSLLVVVGAACSQLTKPLSQSVSTPTVAITPNITQSATGNTGESAQIPSPTDVPTPTTNIIEKVVIVIQALAAAGTLAAALAAWLAVRHAGTSARMAREAVLLPARQEHTNKIKDLLADLSKSLSVDGQDLTPSRPSPQWQVDEVIKPPLASQVLFNGN